MYPARESLTVRIFMRLDSLYRGSFLNRIVTAFSVYYKKSGTHRVLLRFFTKSPTFQYSRTYRIISFVAGKLNGLMSKFHTTFMHQYNKSKTHKIVRGSKRELKRDFVLPLNAFLLPFILGYSLLISIKNTWGFGSLAIVAGLVAVSSISAFTGRHWSNWYGNSGLRKFFRYIWD